MNDYREKVEARKKEVREKLENGTITDISFNTGSDTIRGLTVNTPDGETVELTVKTYPGMESHLSIDGEL